MKLLLGLHPNKTILQPAKNGINFLGYVVRKDYTLVRKRTVKALKRRLYFFNHLLDPITYPFSNSPQMMKLAKLYKSEGWQLPVKPSLYLINAMLNTINSYYGIFAYADSTNLRKHIYEKHFGKLKFFLEPKADNCLCIQKRKGVYLQRQTQRTHLT